jgi:hypothetical protein
MLSALTLATDALADVTLDLTSAKIVWGADGAWKSLYDTVTKQERLVKPTPLMTVVRGGQTLAAGRLEQAGNTLRVWCGAEERPYVFDLAVKPGLLVLRLKDGPVEGLSALTLCECVLKRDGIVAGSIGGMYSDKSGVFLQAVDFNGAAYPADVPEGVHLACTYGSQFGFANAGCALLAVPRRELPGAFERLEAACGMPSPKLSGVWAKLSHDMRRSYLFITDLTEGNVDRVIAYAKRANFAYIQILGDDWAETNGTFAVNKRNFPHGLAGLKATVAKLKAAGFKVGLHFLSAGIAPNDPLVTPVPDDGLYVDTQGPLAQDVDEKADFIPTPAAPDKFPAEDDGYLGHGLTLRIGDEIVKYRERKMDAPFGFVGCIRGAYGTRAAAHKAGDTVKHLYMSYGLFLNNADGPLMDRVASNVARVWNACDCDGVYYDGSEALQGNRDYYNAKIQMSYYRKLNKKNIYAQGSSFSLYTWHLVGRTASADGFRDIKGYLDQRSPAFTSWYDANFMPIDIGWYSINDYIRPDDIEYICSRAVGFNASVSIETGVGALEGHPRSGEMLDTIRKYEDYRLTGKASEALKAQLRIPRNEFRMVVTGGTAQFIPVKYTEWKMLTGVSPAAQEIALHNDRKTPAEVEVDVKVGDTVSPGKGYTSPEAIPLADFETAIPDGGQAAPQLATNQYDPKTYGSQATNQGCTMSIAPVTEDVREGKTACKFEAVSKRNDNNGWAVFTKVFPAPVDLRGMQAIGLWLYGDGNGEAFKVQPRDPKGWRDYYVTVDWKGWRYIELVQPESGELDLSKVITISFYYNGMPAQKTCTVLIDGVKAVKELSGTNGVRITIGDRQVDVRRALTRGCELSIRNNGQCWYYPPHGQGAKAILNLPALPKLEGDLPIRVSPLPDESLSNAVEARAAMLWPKEAL